jgi:PAT family beta-lactamase induction signal transducer AmpG
VNKKLAFLVAVGFASGLPYLLVGSTLSAWLTTRGVALEAVGVLTLVTVPYSIKFTWAPLFDRFSPGFLGRRRGWMVLMQLAIAALLFALGGIDPARAPFPLAVLALACAFFSATNDILTDAYQTDLLLPEERGPGASAAVFGYRAAMLVGGGLALALVEKIPFGTIYRGLALLMIPFTIATALAPEPPESPRPASLRESIVQPLAEYFSRENAIAALVFLLFYRLGDTLVSAMATPFLLGHGYSPAEIGAVNQVLGIGATIVGSVSGGALIARVGLSRSLYVAGALQAVTNLGYAWLAHSPRTHAGLVAVVAVDNLCGGLGVAATVALVMSLCDRRFSATQFALLTSASGLGGRLAAGGSGWLAAKLGWPLFFVATLAPMAPALLFLRRALSARYEAPRS